MVKIWSAVPLPNSTGGLDALAASLSKPPVRIPDLSALGRVGREQTSTEEDLDLLDFMEIMLGHVGKLFDEESDGDSSLNHSLSEDEDEDLVDHIFSNADGQSQNEDEDLETSHNESFVEPAVE